MLQTVIDYAIFPLFVVLFMAIARLLQLHAVPNLFVTPLIVGPFAALVAWLERARPERPEHKHWICRSLWKPRTSSSTSRLATAWR